MSLPSNGITPEVFRDLMPPYHLNADLLAGTFAAMPPPPAKASPAWRRTRIDRLVQEIAIFMPADAAQGRLAAQIVLLRETADDTLARGHAPALTLEQLCRLRRTASDLARTAATLERALTRRQQRPAPFEGTVVMQGVDLAALDAAWCGEAARVAAGDAGDGGGEVTVAPVPPAAAGATPGAGASLGQVGRPAARGQGRSGMAGTDSGDGPAMTNGDERDSLTAAEGDGTNPAERENTGRPATATVRPAPAGLGRDAGPTEAAVLTRLDQGPGWTLDLQRAAPGRDAGRGAAPDVAT